MTRAVLGLVASRRTDRDLAARICDAYVSGLDVEGAALSLLTARTARVTLWATDPIAEELEEIQFAYNEGACMEAARTGNPVLVPDLHRPSETARWPVFAAAVSARTPVAALFALPLQVGAVNMGVVDLYRTRTGGLSNDQWRDALAASDAAAILMLDQRSPHDDIDGSETDGRLRDHDLSHRSEIHQATGMVLAQLGVTADDALARLRAYAFVHDRMLLDVARAVVDRGLVFTPDTT